MRPGRHRATRVGPAPSQGLPSPRLRCPRRGRRVKRKDPQEVSQRARRAGAGMQGRGCCPPLRKCKGAGGLCPTCTPPHPGCLLSTRPEYREGPFHQEAMSSPGRGAGAPWAPPRRAAQSSRTPRGPCSPTGGPSPIWGSLAPCRLAAPHQCNPGQLQPGGTAWAQRLPGGRAPLE